jgi:predicted nucleic acid-binding protein
MDRLFLDANVLFSAAYKPDSRLLQLWKHKDAVVCSSRYAVEEARFNLQDEMQQRALRNLSGTLQLFEAADRLLPRGLSLPDKDAPIFLAAVAARATHLLTGDVQHFGKYFGSKFEGVAIMLPGEYFKLRERNPKR